MANIFVTGGGSLGSALLKFFNESQHRLTVYSRNEFNQAALREQYPNHTFSLGDVRDYDALKMAMWGHDLVIHTSANKRVPDAEVHTLEAINTNVLGSVNVARAAIENEVQRVVGVSTDKACEPHSTYGLTKALMERVFSQMAQIGDTEFVCVRYGNVLRSRGSIVPLFEKQLREGYATFTDPDMTRFWLTMQDAVELIEHTLNARLPPGAVVVPYAPASSIETLADAVAVTAEVGTYERRVLGVRPGEKFHEMLLSEAEAKRAYDDAGHMVLRAATGGPFKEPLDGSYTSDAAPQLTVAELVDMLGVDR